MSNTLEHTDSYWLKKIRDSPYTPEMTEMQKLELAKRLAEYNKRMYRFQL